jgi:histidine triad (HIT) family protein
MSDCIFCKILAGEIPTPHIYEDEDLVAFPDINPKAPTHLLVVPKKHIPKLADLTEQDAALAGKLLLSIGKIAKKSGIAEQGFRVIVNNGGFAGQDVLHLHFHVLGGKPMGWDPA